MPEHRAKQVEAGLATYQKVLAERDELEQRLADAKIKIDGMAVQLESLKSIVNMMESSFKTTEAQMGQRIADHQRERDAAVVEAASLRTVLANINTMLQSALTEQ